MYCSKFRAMQRSTSDSQKHSPNKLPSNGQGLRHGTQGTKTDIT